MRCSERAQILGQDSFLLSTRTVEIAITALGGMLGPVTFFPEDETPIRPYAVAPWAEEPVEPGTPAVIRALRGDWFCSAFGANEELYRGKQLPLHGETANGLWTELDRASTESESWLRLGIDLPLQGGRCESFTALYPGQSVIYQRHDLSGLVGPINPGHHATLKVPSREGSARLSFSRYAFVCTPSEPLERPGSGGYSALAVGMENPDLHAAAQADGSTTDLYRYPARFGYDDVVIICADTSNEFSWSAATVPNDRYAWFAIRNSTQLCSTLLWFSNGGRRYPPWNGRHTNVVGIEDATTFFAVGLAASCRRNSLNERGIRTYLTPDGEGRLSIPYIQGVARIPEGFDSVISIEPEFGSIRLIAKSGVSVQMSCDLEFLRTGCFPGFESKL